MTIQTMKVALQRADETKTNKEGMCQQVVRGYFDAPSAGDRDKDGDSDAADGWFSEPLHGRHPGDRNPPAGAPLYFIKDGGHGNGHRALSRGHGEVRSTDFDGGTKRYKAGVLGNGTIEEVEHAMGVTYLGWSETIDGYPIPAEPKKVSTKKTRGKEVDQMLDLANKALSKAPGAHKHKINEAKKLLLSIDPK